MLNGYTSTFPLHPFSACLFNSGKKNPLLLNAPTPFSFGYNSHSSEEPSTTKLLYTLSLSVLKIDSILL